MTIWAQHGYLVAIALAVLVLEAGDWLDSRRKG